MIHTDKKVATHIPARIPRRVEGDMSIGPTLLSLFWRAGTGEAVRGIRGSLSDDMAAVELRKRDEEGTGVRLPRCEERS